MNVEHAETELFFEEEISLAQASYPTAMTLKIVCSIDYEECMEFPTFMLFLSKTDTGVCISGARPHTDDKTTQTLRPDILYPPGHVTPRSLSNFPFIFRARFTLFLGLLHRCKISS